MVDTWHVFHFFPPDNTTATVHSSWITLNENSNQIQCFWPNEKSTNVINLLAKRKTPPQPEWKAYDGRILKTFGSYDDARRALPKLTECSDASDMEQVQSRLRTHPPPATSQQGINHGPPVKKLRKSKRDAQPSHVLGLVRSDRVPSPSGSSDSSLISTVSFDELQTNHGKTTDDLLESIQNQDNFVNLTVGSKNHDVIPSTSSSTPMATANPMSFATRGLNGNPGMSIHATPTSRRNFVKATDFEAFKEMCATNFAQIKATQSNISGMLVTALETLSRLESDRPAKKAVQIKDFGVTFPMRTSEDVEQVESLLDSNESFKDYMETFLSSLGGDSLSDVTNGILRYLMTDEVALHFNYSGTGVKQKRKFADTATDSLVCDVVCASKVKDATKKNAAKAIGTWLLHANDRLKYKLKSRATSN